ncbi:MAG: hypothetical protein ACREXW_16385 [Gammaproteobacteria bacterium]
MVELTASEEGEGGDVHDLAGDGDLGLAELARAVLQALAGERRNKTRPIGLRSLAGHRRGRPT